MPERIRNKLVDEFSQTVLNGAIAIAADTANPIRGNLFAVAIRELLTHTIHTLAPDESVQDCPWFEAEIETGKPTRRQRFQYMIHGGIDKRYARDVFHLPVDELLNDLTRAFEKLNRATHLREGTIIADQEKFDELSDEIFSTFEELFNTIDACKRAAMHAASSTVEEEILNEAITNTIPTIDLLATHHYIDEVGINEITTLKIDSEYIWYHASGVIEAVLQYGSGSDRRNDNGAEINHSFPFECDLPAKVENPQKIETALIKLEVDEGGWSDSAEGFE